MGAVRQRPDACLDFSLGDSVWHRPLGDDELRRIDFFDIDFESLFCRQRLFSATPQRVSDRYA